MGITQGELDERIRLHGAFLCGEPGGVRLDLSGMDLRGANLTHAILTDAILRGANLIGTNLNDAKGVIKVGTSADNYGFFGVAHADGPMVKAGCRWFALEQARAHWQETRGGTDLGDERLRFVDMIERHFAEQEKEDM